MGDGQRTDEGSGWTIGIHKEGWDQLSGDTTIQQAEALLVFTRVKIRRNHVLEINLSYSGLEGSIPDLGNLVHLYKLDLGGNNLAGQIPDFTNCPKLRSLSVANNPRLGGVISKALVSQCETLKYSGCKQQPDIDGPHMQGPFITGASFACDDMASVMIDFGHLLNGRRTCRLMDVPNRDPNTGWVNWQAAWLDGLRSMSDDQPVYIFCGSDAFRSEFTDWKRWFDPERHCTVNNPNKAGNRTDACSKCSFEPTLELQSGQCATSILDWERRHILAEQKKRGLKVIHVNGKGREMPVRPAWYTWSEFEGK